MKIKRSALYYKARRAAKRRRQDSKTLASQLAGAYLDVLVRAYSRNLVKSIAFEKQRLDKTSTITYT